MFNDFIESLPKHKGNSTVGLDGPIGGEVSADHYAGQTAANGKPIWSAQQAADNLSRPGVDWTFGNNGALDDGILTYGFWTEEEVENSYYLEDGASKILTDSFYIKSQKFAPFTAEQQAMATANLQLWDDLIAVTFQKAASPSEADITFGFVQMSPAAGAHAYYPQEEAFDEFYGTEDLGRSSGDVWANYLYQDSFSGANTQIGAYGWFAITHELGHSLGLAHGGDYNASDDNDGDGQPDPITYEGDAYFFQDSQQYTIMSYFDGSYTGQSAVKWAGADTVFVMAQTPQVHDILSVQQIYGADMTTRAGNTVYGFNSTADRAVFDFTINTAPVLTIWDAGGRDTLDLSGFDGNNVIDINEGAFSSAGYKIDAASKAYFGAAFGLTTEAEFAAFYANNGLGPDGRPVDNIAIAYGAKIESAKGGSGNDTLIGNGLSNVLTGNAGDDRFIGGDKTDVFLLGAGNDTVVGQILSKVTTKVGKLSLDIVKDFNLNGDDLIDLSGLDANTKVRGDQAFAFTGTGGANAAGQISYTTYANIAAAEKALNYDIDGVAGVGTVSGPVTVVFGNVDGGTADFGLILLGTAGVTASDFIF